MECFQSNLGTAAHASLWASVVTPSDPHSSASPVVPNHRKHTILLPSVSACAAFAAMHQLHPSNADGPSTMALSAVTLAIGSTADDCSRPGATLTVRVARDGATTADCNGIQTLFCRASRIMASDPVKAPSTANTFAGGGIRSEPLSGRFANRASQSLVAVVPHLRGSCSGEDACGLGQMIVGEDTERYAMSPEDMEAAAQLASGGPEVLLAAAAGLRAQPSGRAMQQGSGWLAGCAYPLGPVQVGGLALPRPCYWPLLKVPDMCKAVVVPKSRA